MPTEDISSVAKYCYRIDVLVMHLVLGMRSHEISIIEGYLPKLVRPAVPGCH